MKTLALYVLGGAAIIGGCIGLEWLSLGAGRPMAKYAEETRAQVYDTSRQYQQGTNRDIARYCETMRTAPQESSRKAVAALIRSTADTFEGELSPDNLTCLNEAKGDI